MDKKCCLQSEAETHLGIAEASKQLSEKAYYKARQDANEAEAVGDMAQYTDAVRQVGKCLREYSQSIYAYNDEQACFDSEQFTCTGERKVRNFLGKVVARQCCNQNRIERLHSIGATQ